MSRRRCSKPSCTQPAVSTLTYVYADSTAVVGPLATYAEPHCYDLCQMHSDRLTAPKGWEVVRITPDPDALKPSVDDLEALANAVREAARPRYERSVAVEAEATDEPAGLRRGHLRVVPDVAHVDFAATQVPSRVEADVTESELAESPMRSPQPERSTVDEPFDHERLW